MSGSTPATVLQLQQLAKEAAESDATYHFLPKGCLSALAEVVAAAIWRPTGKFLKAQLHLKAAEEYLAAAEKVLGLEARSPARQKPQGHTHIITAGQNVPEFTPLIQNGCGSTPHIDGRFSMLFLPVDAVFHDVMIQAGGRGQGSTPAAEQCPETGVDPFPHPGEPGHHCRHKEGAGRGREAHHGADGAGGEVSSAAESAARDRASLGRSACP